MKRRGEGELPLPILHSRHKHTRTWPNDPLPILSLTIHRPLISSPRLMVRGAKRKGLMGEQWSLCVVLRIYTCHTPTTQRGCPPNHIVVVFVVIQVAPLLLRPRFLLVVDLLPRIRGCGVRVGVVRGRGWRIGILGRGAVRQWQLDIHVFRCGRDPVGWWVVAAILTYLVDLLVRLNQVDTHLDERAVA